MATLAEITPILEKVYEGKRLTFEDGVALLKSPHLLEIGAAADYVRRKLHPDNTVTFIIDRNINYTNVCVAQCSFCAFKRNVGDPEGYVLPWEVIDAKCQELKEQGGTQVLLQGGLNPALKLDYYQKLIDRIQSKWGLTVHGFSPAEIWYLAKISRLSVRDTLLALKEAGLRSIPGGGGEILDDRVRSIIGKGKVLTDQWFEVMETAQELGMNTTATMMYGHIETIEERVMTLIRIRESADKYHGYSAFIHWDFQPDNTALGEEMARHPDKYHLGTGLEYLKLLAVARLILDNIPNLQVSWVTQGPKLAQVALHFGANDFGGTMMEENVVSAAGTTYRVTPPEAVRLIRDAGFTPAKRDTFYNILERY
ncbi:MAG: dehypoxanthine futalosine cyclase [Firmicutes bacterium]|nr:dehypoxanthine futalosine cyclase [Bacillota bacterium]